jgi:hypothetical protein
VVRISPRFWYYSNKKKAILIPINKKKYHSYAAFDICRRSARYNPQSPYIESTTLPGDTIPIDIYKYTESIFFKFAPITDKPTIQQQPKDTSRWKREILQHLQVLDMTPLYNDLGNKDIQINIVSDGGVHNYHRNFGLVIATKSRILAQNKGQIYSVEFHESSIRNASRNCII